MEIICTKDYYDSIFQFKKGDSTNGDSRYLESYKKQLLADHPDMFKVVDGTENTVVAVEEEPTIITTKNFTKRSSTKG